MRTANNLSPFGQQLKAAVSSLKLAPPAPPKPRCLCHNKYLTVCPAQQQPVVREKKIHRIK